SRRANVWVKKAKVGGELVASVPPDEPLWVQLREFLDVPALEQRITVPRGKTADVTFDLASAPVVEFEVTGIPRDALHDALRVTLDAPERRNEAAWFVPFYDVQPDDDGIVRVVAGPGRVLRMSFGNLRYGSMVDLVDARTGAMDFEVVASQRFVVG